MQFGPMNSVMAVSPCRLWYEPLLKSFPNQRCICLSPALFLRGLFERCGYSFRPDLLEIEKERSVAGEEGSVDARISQPYPHVKRRRRRHYAPDLELDGPPRPALGAVIRRMGIRPLYITRTNGSHVWEQQRGTYANGACCYVAGVEELHGERTEGSSRLQCYFVSQGVWDDTAPSSFDTRGSIQRFGAIVA